MWWTRSTCKSCNALLARPRIAVLPGRLTRKGSWCATPPGTPPPRTRPAQRSSRPLVVWSGPSRAMPGVRCANTRTPHFSALPHVWSRGQRSGVLYPPVNSNHLILCLRFSFFSFFSFFYFFPSVPHPPFFFFFFYMSFCSFFSVSKFFHEFFTCAGKEIATFTPVPEEGKLFSIVVLSLLLSPSLLSFAVFCFATCVL